MKKHNIHKKILINADAAWDFRQGTMTKISPDFAALVTTQPEYYTRRLDRFGPSDNQLKPEIYEKVFKRYQHDIFRISLKTEIYGFLLDLCKQYIKQVVYAPFLTDFSLEFNIYPIVLSEEEEREIIACLKELLGELKFSIVRIAPEQLTLANVREHYTAMVMYNYHDWLNLHHEEMKKSNIRDVGLFVPRLFFGDVTKLSDEALKELHAHGKDEFDIFRELLIPFVNIQMLPVSLFCASTPVNLPQYRALIKEA